MSAPLSNFTVDRAESARSHWNRYRATRRESIEAYIAADMDLLDGLSAIRHGQKGAYYKRRHPCRYRRADADPCPRRHDGGRVLDASIVPTLTAGNTNAPAIMIGGKGADPIKEGAA